LGIAEFLIEREARATRSRITCIEVIIGQQMGGMLPHIAGGSHNLPWQFAFHGEVPRLLKIASAFADRDVEAQTYAWAAKGDAIAQ
jgi:hypothetical protein